MATISDCRAVYGLSAVATPTSTNTSGTVTVGVGQTQIRLTNGESPADVAYSLSAFFPAAGNSLVLDLLENDTTGSDAYVAGTRQVETATVVAAAGITGDGNAEVIITGSGITGSPLTITVAVTTALTTATLVAGALRTAVAATAAVTDLYDVGGTGADITLTRKATTTETFGGLSFPVYPANDGTLNIATQNGTCTGITTAASSANTTAGVATSGVYILDGDGKDLEGIDIPTIAVVRALLIQSTSGTCDIAGVTDDVFSLNSAATILITGGADSAAGVENSYTFTSTVGAAIISITVVGSTV